MVLRVLLSILLPPVGVLFTVGLGKHFWLNLVLTLLGYLPGIIHAIWLITREHEQAKIDSPGRSRNDPLTI